MRRCADGGSWWAGTPGAPAVGMQGQREACVVGVSWRPRVVVGGKNPLPGPQAAFAQIWDSICVKPSTVGNRHASGRNGWFCWWWMLSSRDHLHPMPASALDCCHSRFLFHLSLGHWSMSFLVLSPLPVAASSSSLGAGLSCPPCPHSRGPRCSHSFTACVLCVWQQLVRVSSESGGFSTTYSLGACLLTQHLSPYPGPCSPVPHVVATLTSPEPLTCQECSASGPVTAVSSALSSSTTRQFCRALPI